MTWASQELVGLLSFLIPGFLAAWIFFGLTAYPKPSPFERIVQALILTILVQGAVAVVEQIAYLLGGWLQSELRWTEESGVVAAIPVATALGLVLAYFVNNDTLHKVLRRFDVTRETSLPSEWFGNFAERETWVVLHLSGERRIYGWPKEWPSQPGAGHFVLTDAEWLTEEATEETTEEGAAEATEEATEEGAAEGAEEGRIPLDGVEAILVPATEVSFVEFMRFDGESEDDQETAKSPSTAQANWPGRGQGQV